MNQGRREQPAQTPPAPPPGAGGTDGQRQNVGGDILGVITDVESRLSQLRDAHATRERERAELQKKSDAIAVRENALVERERAIDASRAQVRAARDSIEAAQKGMAERKAALEERQRKLEEAESALSELESQTQSQLDAAKADLDRRTAALEQQAARLAEQQETLQTKREQITRDREAAAQAMQEAQAAAESAAEQARQTQAQIQQAEAQQAEFRAAAERAEEGARVSAERAGALESRLEELRAHAGGLESQLSALTSEADELRDQSRQRQERIDQLEEHARQLKSQLAAAAADAGTQVNSLREAVQQRDGRIGQLEARAGELEESLRSAGAEAHSQIEAARQAAAEADQRRKQAEERARQLQQQLEDASSGASDREVQLADAVAARDARIAELEQAQTSFDDRLAKTAAEAEQVEAKLREEIDGRDVRIESLTGRLEELKSAAAGAIDPEELDRLNAELHKATSEAAAAREAAQQLEAQAQESAASAADRIRSLERDVAEREELLIALRRQVEEAGAQQADPEQIAALQAAIAERDQAIAGLRGQLESAGGEDEVAARLQEEIGRRDQAIATLQQQLEQAGAGAGSAAPDDSNQQAWQVAIEHLSRRRRRLQSVREALDGRAADLTRAAETLAKKFKELEAARAAAARQPAPQAPGATSGSPALEVPRPKQAPPKPAATRTDRFKLDLGSVAKRATLVMALFSASMAISAVLSWIIANQVAPATYAATATLAADANGQPMDDDSLAGWLMFHEEFLADPRFAEAAAQQLGRRGITSLAQPGLLSAELTANFTHFSPEPGKLTLEYRAEGATRARRIAETLTAALATQANLSRDRRADGLKSVVSAEADIMQPPIADGRIVYAAGVFACFVGVTLGVGFLVMRQTYTMMKKIREEGRAADEFAHVEVPEV